MCVDESAVVADVVVPVPAKPTIKDILTLDVLANSNVTELLDAKATVESLLKERVAKENAAMKSSIEAIAKATGVPVERVLESLAPEKPKRTRAKKDEEERKPNTVKFRHPTNPDLTWSGRGREPKWLEEARNDGLTDQELLAA